MLTSYCRVFDKNNETYSDVPIEEYDRIKEALNKFIAFRDDELIETTLVGSGDRTCFLISTIASVSERTPEGLQASWRENRAFDELKKSAIGWDE